MYALLSSKYAQFSLTLPCMDTVLEILIHFKRRIWKRVKKKVIRVLLIKKIVQSLHLIHIYGDLYEFLVSSWAILARSMPTSRPLKLGQHAISSRRNSRGLRESTTRTCWIGYSLLLPITVKGGKYLNRDCRDLTVGKLKSSLSLVCQTWSHIFKLDDQSDGKSLVSFGFRFLHVHH